MRADGAVGPDEHVDSERLGPDAAGLRDADRVSHRPWDRLRAGDDRWQARGVRIGPHDLFPRGRQRDRLLGAERSELRDESAAVPGCREQHQLRLQLGLHRLRPHRVLRVRLVPATSIRNISRLPDPRSRTVRLAGLRLEHAHPQRVAVRSAPPGGRSGLPRLLEQQASPTVGRG